MKDKNQEHTNCLIRVLIAAMIALVVIVAFMAFFNGYCSRNTEKLILDNKVSVPKDSSCVYVTVPMKDFEKMIKMKGIESNDYLTIILTLITLCATLSAVIPYIVGKSVTENQVRETVEKCMDYQTKENERILRETIEQLESAEAHISRMISYELLYDVKDIKFDSFESNTQTQDFDQRIHPFWALGWASKSMIRYIKVPPKFHNQKFVNYAVQYILSAGEMITKIKIDDSLLQNSSLDLKGKLIRAFVDLFDALGYYYSYTCNEKLNLKLEDEKQEALSTLLANLYDIIKNNNFIEDLNSAIKQKSAYKSYFAKDSNGNVAEEKIKEYLKYWVEKKRFSKEYYR